MLIGDPSNETHPARCERGGARLVAENGRRDLAARRALSEAAARP
jgi:hypothetical protein